MAWKEKQKAISRNGKMVVFYSLLIICLLACRRAEPPLADYPEINIPDTIVPFENKGTIGQIAPALPPPDYDTSEWTEVTRLDSTIRLDLKYATTDNFVEQVMYACPRCFLRPKVALAVVAVHQELQREGLGLKLFDCYRPRDVQWKLWEIVPEPGYVADPAKGSVHNRGGAVDLTIVDATGQELDMGTTFDFFGPEANHTYQAHPENVLANRQKLKTVMAQHGMAHIRTEWWHYKYAAERYELADEEWLCPN